MKSHLLIYMHFNYLFSYMNIVYMKRRYKTYHGHFILNERHCSTHRVCKICSYSFIFNATNPINQENISMIKIYMFAIYMSYIYLIHVHVCQFNKQINTVYKFKHSFLLYNYVHVFCTAKNSFITHCKRKNYTPNQESAASPLLDEVQHCMTFLFLVNQCPDS